MTYPFIPIISDFNKQHLITGDLENAAMIFASSIDINPLSTAQYQTLFSSSKNSSTRLEPIDISPMAFETDTFFTGGPYIMAVSSEGTYPSVFTENSQIYTGAKPFRAVSEPTKIVVVGDGDFVTDQYLRSPINLTLFLNIVDWLTSPEGEGLISIRSREVTNRPLKEIESYTARNII
jgi:ABC-type uncharacterized transport system involved in gliding motility auxiliary subunit